METEDKWVLVTGAAGFIGSNVVQQLLLAGYRVRGSIRSLDNQYQVDALNNLIPDATHKLQLVQADLKQDEGWDEAVEGCWAVLHLASLIPSINKYPSEEEFFEVIVRGTERVLNASVRAGVTKFVFAADFNGAVNGDPKPFVAGKVYSGDDYMDLDYPNIERFSKTKRLAEDYCWSIVNKLPAEQRPQLTVLVHCAVCGPPLYKHEKLHGALEVIHALITAKAPGCLNLKIHLSDVREITDVYLQCLTNPEVAGKRILIATKETWVPEIAQILSKEFKGQGYSIYTNILPTFLIKMYSFFFSSLDVKCLIPKLGLDILISYDQMKMFNLKIRPLEETLIDMVYAMIDLGMVPKGKYYKEVGSRSQQKTQH